MSPGLQKRFPGPWNSLQTSWTSKIWILVSDKGKLFVPIKSFLFPFQLETVFQKKNFNWVKISTSQVLLHFGFRAQVKSFEEKYFLTAFDLFGNVLNCNFQKCVQNNFLILAKFSLEFLELDQKKLPRKWLLKLLSRVWLAVSKNGSIWLNEMGWIYVFESKYVFLL